MRDRFYSTADLARVCGVSISTIKRWTDAGLLRCVRTPGGHRKYRVQDVAEAARRLGLCGVDTAQPAARVDELALLLLQGDRPAITARLAACLRAGDATGARQLLLDLHRHGMPLADAVELLGTARREFAGGAAGSEQDAFVCRRASQLAATTARLLLEQIPPAPVGAPGALVATAPAAGDGFAPVLALLQLAERGWRVVDLGVDATPALVRGGLLCEHAELVVLVVERDEPALVAALRAEADAAGAELVVHAAGGTTTLAVLRSRAAARERRLEESMV